MRTTPSEAAVELAQRINDSRHDYADIDEAGRPPSDKPPEFAEALLPGTPSIENGAHLTAPDWDIIVAALEHYATCGTT